MSLDLETEHYSREKQVIIEYHDVNEIKIIHYEDFTRAVQEISNSLKKLVTTKNNSHLSHCIAIYFDVKQYCIPTLIGGIINSSKFSFVFKPSSAPIDICKELSINLIFSHRVLPNSEILLEFNLHDEILFLLRFKDVRVKQSCSLKCINSSPLKFYYAIATSGTTGPPKIVRVTDKCILLNIQDFEHLLDLSASDKISQLTPLTFDPSMIEIFLCIKCSCTLFMASDEVKNNPRLLMEKIINNKVTVLQTTPSLLLGKWSKETLRRQLLSEQTSLKVLILGGEPFIKLEVLSGIREKGNCTRFFNVYGVTEVSCWSSLHEIVPDSVIEEEIRTDCIGKPLSETIFEVRSDDDKIITDGEGILHIGSQTRLCQLDKEPIILDNLPLYRNTGDTVKIKSGNIYYIGRADSVIKRLGNKLNLNKLEYSAESSNLVTKCVTVWDEDLYKLILFVIPSSDTYDVFNLKSEIRNHLKCMSNFYQPDKIHIVKSLPVTEHGKICKTTLRDICNQREKPFENLESIVRNLWQEHLGMCNDDGFLSLGGTSITALQISNVLANLLNIELAELITIFLKNVNFSECVAFISKTIDEKNGTNTESKNEKKLEDEEKEKPKENITVCNEMKTEVSEEVDADSKCLWQTSRGSSHNRSDLLGVESVALIKTYDLKKCVDATPTIFKYSSGTVFATVGSHSGIIRTIALNKDCSKEYYQVKLPDRIEASVLVLDNFHGVVGCYDGYVYCVQLKTGEIIWKFKTGNLVKCTALGCNLHDCFFVGSYDTYMYSLRKKDGKELWKTKVSAGSITAKPQFILNETALLVATLDGTCAVLDLKSGEIKWEKKVSYPIFSSPAVLSNGYAIFCTVIGIIFCFDIENDLEVWTFSTKLNIFSYPVVHKDSGTDSENICIVAHDTFFRLECDAKDMKNPPTLRFKVKLKSLTFCTPWCEGNIVFLADSDGIVYVLEFHDGMILAEMKLKGAIFSSPIIHEDKVIVGSRDNNMYILKIIYS